MAGRQRGQGAWENMHDDACCWLRACPVAPSCFCSHTHPSLLAFLPDWSQIFLLLWLSHLVFLISLPSYFPPSLIVDEGKDENWTRDNIQHGKRSHGNAKGDITTVPKHGKMGAE
jgi:hypothetical protein